MGEDIVARVLLAEEDLQSALREAENRAQLEVDVRKKEQESFLNTLRLAWDQFESEEAAKLSQRLQQKEQQLAKQTEQLKMELRQRMLAKADAISERLKQEVMAAHGDR